MLSSVKPTMSFTMEVWESSTAPNSRNSPFWGVPTGLQLFGSLQLALTAPVQSRAIASTGAVHQPSTHTINKPGTVKFASERQPLARRVEEKCFIIRSEEH